MTGDSILRLCALLWSHFNIEGGGEEVGEGGGGGEKSKLSNRSIRLVTAQCILRICKSHSDVEAAATVSPAFSFYSPFVALVLIHILL